MMRNDATPSSHVLMSLVHSTVQDLRYGIRGLRRALAFALTAVLTLALGIGAISTVLTLINTYF